MKIIRATLLIGASLGLLINTNAIAYISGGGGCSMESCPDKCISGPCVDDALRETLRSWTGKDEMTEITDKSVGSQKTYKVYYGVPPYGYGVLMPRQDNRP